MNVELIQKIREVLQQSPFHGEGYRKVWAKLRYKGIRTSRRRVLRLMRQEGLLAFQRLGNPRGSKAHEGTILKEEPDQMWGTDMTSTWTGQGQACLFVAVDHCTCECIGIHASRSGNRWQALGPLRQGVRCYLGGFAAAVAPGLEIRHDHGSAYLSDDFQSEIAFWGMESSPAFVREPEGNGCAERFIRTLKENLLWTRSFDTIDELREALLAYNGLGTGLQLAREFDAGNTQGTRILHEWEGELMTEEEKRLTGRVSTLRRLLPPFVCAIYNGQARDWDREAVLSMLTGKNNLKGEDLPARLTEDDVMAYIDKRVAQHESKIHT